MTERTDKQARLQKAIVQKLESLHRSGVRSFPRTEIEVPVSKPAAKTNSRARTTAPPQAPQAKQAEPVKPQAPAAAPKTAAASNTSSPPTRRQPSAPQVSKTAAFTSPPIPAGERDSALQILSNEVAQCTRCSELANSRTQTVFGVGNPNSQLVFFGEAPGADEDRQGEPFVGKAGQLLTKIIEACRLKRSDVYIMNVLRCRPPGNRNPTPDEAQNCRPFFERQFEIIRPEFICCLGSIAATTLLNTTASVGRLRGKFHDWRGMKVVVTYHPAYLLRNAGAKKHVWADMKMLMKEMGTEL